MNSRHPLARTDQLIVRELESEVLVYDLTRKKALCLNSLAGAVWKLSDGTRSAEQLATEISAQLGASVDEQLVWSAIDRLGRDHLLEYCIPAPNLLSRREQLKSLGKAAAIAGPMVAALSAPLAAQSSSCIKNNQPCQIGGTPCCTPSAVCAPSKKGPATCAPPGQRS